MPPKTRKQTSIDVQKTLFDHFASSPAKGTSTATHKVQNLEKNFKSTRSKPPSNATTPTFTRNRLTQEVLLVDSDDEDTVDGIHFEVKHDEVQLRSPMLKRGHGRCIIGDDSEPENRESNAGDVQSSEFLALRPVKQRAKRKQVVDSDGDSSSEDVLLKGKKKSRLVKGRRPPSVEVEDLLDEIDEERILDSRLRQRSSKRSVFEKNLERLKRKKNRQPVSESQSSQEDDHQDAPSPPRHVMPFKDARPDKEQDAASIAEVIDSGSDESDFIVEDDNNADTAALPAAFSMNSHQDMTHHFKIICQFMVHLATIPEERRLDAATIHSENEYFSVPLYVVRRKLSGIRDSVASSVWRPDFKKALQTFPEFTFTVMNLSLPYCDACHLGGRRSTLIGRLSGSPYDELSYTTRDPSKDVKKMQTEFNFGRFCAKRTRLFHQLIHWEYALFTALQDEIRNLEEPSSSRPYVPVAFAGGKKPPEDLSDGDQLMDWLDERGIIQLEWVKIRELMSQATNLEIDTKRGDTLD